MQLYKAYNGVITKLITANELFDSKNKKKQKQKGDKTKYESYFKAADSSTNFVEADISALVKGAIIVSNIKIPEGFARWKPRTSNCGGACRILYCIEKYS